MLIMCYICGYIIQKVSPEFMAYLTLNPYEILKGQVWRIITWVLVPPDDLGILTFIMLYFYYYVGQNLERTWGTYRYNVFMFSGIFFTVIGSFVALGLVHLLTPDMVSNPMLEKTMILLGSTVFSTYYINMSIFLAFAITFPEVEVLFMLIIPVKMKWLALADCVYLGYELIRGANINPNSEVAVLLTQFGVNIAMISLFFNIFIRTAIIASLFNVLIFFIRVKANPIKNAQRIQRKVEFNHKVRKGMSGNRGHVCATCGRTKEEYPQLEFRFCSKCVGEREYCEEHIFTHSHTRE